MKPSYIIQNLVLQASINVVLFCFVLFTFYFYYVTSEEDKGVIKLLNDILGLTPHDGKDNTVEVVLREALKFVPNEHMAYVKQLAIDAEVERDKHNNRLIWNTVTAILILSVVLFAINTLIAIASGKEYKVDVAVVIIENLVFAAILLVLRYIFFVYVVKRWQRLSKPAMLYEVIKPYTPSTSTKV